MGHEWKTAVNHRKSGTECPKCIETLWTSKGEIEVAAFIESLGENIIRNDRILLSGYEIDILIPSRKVAIEYHGNYWHSSPEAVVKDAHKVKCLRTLEYLPLVVWESDWKESPDAVRGALLNYLHRGKLSPLLTTLTIGDKNAKIQSC